MAKPGKKKKSCEKYKIEGHLEENKLKKKLRNEKRIEKFRKRRESGPHETCGYFEPANQGSKRAKHTIVSRLRSIFAKLHKETEKEKAELSRLQNEILRNEKHVIDYMI